MQIMMVCASHSPLFYFPHKISESYQAVREAVSAARERIARFDPELVILFGGDHYGGHQMASMPAFCVGIEATALADVGGTPGRLRVPRQVAVDAVNALRRDDVDVAVSYAMEVDHGFSLALDTLAGGLETYPVLPIFVSCIQPPFVPFRRARALGEAVGRYASGLPYERILLMGTGGISHDPEFLFPSIDNVSEQWRPYILAGRRQTDVPQQAWIDYEIEAHKQGAVMLADLSVPIETYKIKKDWDQAFLAAYCAGDMALFDAWSPADVVATAGIGAMETLSWVAAAAAMKTATGARPREMFHRPCQEIGVGFGIAEAGPAEVHA
jgi:2,3-dihydroxyphenylpropionate 1,2-dioxygenase